MSRGTDRGAPCPSHKFRNLGYVATSADADRRIANGERQRRCPVCLRWIWRSEFGPGWKKALPDLALDALIEAQSSPCLNPQLCGVRCGGRCVHA
jgi:hypothetical protein